jgi:type I restriction enzyme M protein
VAAEASAVVQRLWNFCTVLRDDGVSYGDYVEQLTFLLFLKMDDEQTKPPYNKESNIPEGCRWDDLRSPTLRGDELEVKYRHLLETLGKERGTLGVIFRKAQNKIQDPAKLKRLIDLIGGETWLGMDVDLKGDIYEGLLEKNAQDVKSGAGQYFTPRTIIRAMVEVMRPTIGETVADPACGTGGFLLAAYDYIASHKSLDRDQKQTLRAGTLFGTELVDATARLALMNMHLHGIGGEASPITVADALAAHPGQRFDMVLTNPPFGRKSSVTVVNGDGEVEKDSLEYSRDDFWVTTSNKQLNFVQHVWSILKVNGRAAVVVPDNVLFEGGAGEVVRTKLLKEGDLHTILRLPTGIFYASGVKANVLFFDRKPPQEQPWTKDVWFYDLRTNHHFTLKTKPLVAGDLVDFLACYQPENRHTRTETEQFKKFTYDELIARDKVNLDIFWLKDESLENMENLPEPAILAAEIVENLEAALAQFSEVYAKLQVGVSDEPA